MDLIAELHTRLEAPPARQHRLIGLEHEFTVHDGGAPVDFRTLIGSLDLDGRRLDPGDPHAVRGRWGGIITADGAEAEIATPPVAARPRFSDELAGWAAVGASQLRSAVPHLQLAGYSTHVSVEVDDRRVVRTAHRFSQRFALAQMLLMDRADSPGLLVRPRRHRLELCGEYVTGTQLRASAVFAVAATAASERRTKTPTRLRPRLEPAHGRYGTYVDRRAFGPDLYREGRSTKLPGGWTAQDVLELSWDLARPFASASPDEVQLVDRIVQGHAPLPLESPEVDDGVCPGTVGQAPTGRVVEARVRSGVRVDAAIATWAGTAFLIEGGTRTAVVTVPLLLLDPFLAALDAGHLDDVLQEALLMAPALPRLATSEQLAGVGVFGGIAAPAGLVAAERDPLTGRIGGGGRGRREDKDAKQEHPKPRKAPRLVVAAAAVIGALVLIAALAAAVGRDEPEQLVAGSGGATTTTEPDPEPTPSIPVPTAALPATQIPPEVWRGWVASARDHEFTPGARDYQRSWWVDGSSSSLAVVYQLDISYYFEQAPVGSPVACIQTESFGTIRGAGISIIESVTSLRQVQAEDDDVPGFRLGGGATSAEGPVNFVTGIHRFCDGTSRVDARGGSPYAVSPVGMPADLTAVPETLSHRQVRPYAYDRNQLRTVQVCLTRATVDSDSDGLPDPVDLDPQAPAPLLDLGTPGGFGGTPIPSRVDGGPGGIEGVPECPAAGGGATSPSSPPAPPAAGGGAPATTTSTFTASNPTA